MPRGLKIPESGIDLKIILASVVYLLAAIASIGWQKAGLIQLLFVLPIALGAVIMIFFYFQKAFFFTMFILPLSLQFLNVGQGLGVSIPGEPMIACLLGLFFVKFLLDPILDRKVLLHPISLLIFLELAWIGLTSLTSSMKFISLKYVVMRAVFIGVFFLVLSVLFRNPKNRVRFFLAIGGGLAMVSIYALIHHATYGFGIQYHIIIARPFFSDHTIFGACLAMLLPMGIFMVRDPGLFGIEPRHRKLLYAGMFLIVAALFFSFSRAAWLSIVVSGGAWAWLRLRLKFNLLMLVLLMSSIALFGFRSQILIYLQSNKSASNENLTAHVQSVTNISTDNSNVERLNRWNSALKMFQEKPLTGFGPGTYSFQYGPFQDIRLMTRISTKKGDRGGTHSEYLRALSESGLPGMIFYLGILLLVLYRGMRIVYTSKDPRNKALATGALLGLVTYFFHGIVNNFLETDKFAGLFFGMVCLLVCLDVYGNKTEHLRSGGIS